MTGHKDHFARTPTGAITPDAIKNLQRNMTTASYEDEHSMVEDARYIREHLPALLTDMHPDQNSRDLILTLAKTPGKLSQKPPTHLGSVALHYIVARARAWQHLMGSANLDTTQPMIRALFAQLKRLRVQWGNHVYIHGMGLRHEPKHGSDWTQDVTHWWEMLCAMHQPKQPPRTTRRPVKRKKRSRRAACAPNTARRRPPMNWPGFALTRNNRVVIVGGERKPRVLRRLKRALQCSKMEWVIRRGDNPRTLQQLRDRIAAGTVNLVILLQRFVGHDTSDLVVAPAKAHSVPVAFVPRGYGLTQVCMAIEKA